VCVCVCVCVCDSCLLALKGHPLGRSYVQTVSVQHFIHSQEVMGERERETYGQFHQRFTNSFYTHTDPQRTKRH